MGRDSGPTGTHQSTSSRVGLGLAAHKSPPVKSNKGIRPEVDPGALA